MKTKTSFIYTMITNLTHQIVAYDNPSHSDEFREAIRDAVKALKNLRKFF